MKNKVSIYDTTLRDGAQATGVSFSATGKILLAKIILRVVFPDQIPKIWSFLQLLKRKL